MKVLVFGAAGMLGSSLIEKLAGSHELHAAARARHDPAWAARGVTVHQGVDLASDAQLRSLLDRVGPDVTVNAAGVVKQYFGQIPMEEIVAVNALAPHKLARFAAASGSHLIHISTDCVYSGAKGCYSETDAPDPTDTYGMSKLLGEPDGANVTVIRTSMIGLESPALNGHTHGLVEWFLAQRGRVPGFRRAMFSGLTVRELSRVIDPLIERRDLAGLWHVAAAPISKYDLLRGLAERLPEIGISVEPVDGPAIDRSLNGAAFNAVMGWVPPDWDHMLDELSEDIRARGRALS